MVDVAAYLRSKGLQVKRGDARNVHVACVFCGEDPGKRGRLYVNVDDDAGTAGLYQCKICGAAGNLTLLKRHFGDQVNDHDIDHETRSDILNRAARYYHAALDLQPSVLAYLKGPHRGLGAQTIEAHQLGYAVMDITRDLADGTTTVVRARHLYQFLRREGFAVADILATGLCQEASAQNTIVDALTGMVTIPYHVAGNVVAIRGRTWPFEPDDFTDWDGPSYPPPPSKYKTCSGTPGRLFNSDVTWGAEEIVIAEGEADCLVLEQEGYAAVGVPGASAWQQSWDSYLDNARRVWLLYDRDAAGEKAAVKLVERLGSKVRRVHLSEEGVKCDPTQWFADGHTRDEFEGLLRAARRGGLLVSVQEARDEFASVQSQPGINFSWELLDLMIAPGLQQSQLMFFLSPTNTGKTLMLLNLMHRARMDPAQRDLKVLFVSLEQTRGEWWDRARRIHRFFNIESDEEEAAEFWEDNLMLVDRNRLSEGEFRQVMEDYAYHMGEMPGLVCVDYLGYWAQAFKGEPYERTSRAAMALKAIATDYRVPIMVPHQVNRSRENGQEFGIENARDSGVVGETADFLLTMWSPDQQVGREPEEKTGQLHLRLAKSRHGGRDTLFNMQFAPISLVMVPEGDPLCGAARLEMSWQRKYRDNWHQAVYRHVTGFDGPLAWGPDGHVHELRKGTR